MDTEGKTGLKPAVILAACAMVVSALLAVLQSYEAGKILALSRQENALRHGIIEFRIAASASGASKEKKQAYMDAAQALYAKYRGRPQMGVLLVQAQIAGSTRETVAAAEAFTYAALKELDSDVRLMPAYLDMINLLALVLWLAAAVFASGPAVRYYRRAKEAGVFGRAGEIGRSFAQAAVRVVQVVVRVR